MPFLRKTVSFPSFRQAGECPKHLECVAAPTRIQRCSSVTFIVGNFPKEFFFCLLGSEVGTFYVDGHSPTPLCNQDFGCGQLLHFSCGFLWFVASILRPVALRAITPVWILVWHWLSLLRTPVAHHVMPKRCFEQNTSLSRDTTFIAVAISWRSPEADFRIPGFLVSEAAPLEKSFPGLGFFSFIHWNRSGVPMRGSHWIHLWSWSRENKLSTNCFCSWERRKSWCSTK